MPSMRSRRWRLPPALLALALLAGCGRAEQSLQPTSLAPLAPAPASTTAMPAAQTQSATLPPSARLTPPVPNSTAAYLRTRIAFNRNSADATITAEAAWALTPEPTILPPKDGPHLRDVWLSSPQQTSAPSRLYLRSQGGDGNADTFWEVRLPDARLRRLPVVEEESLDNSARVSPDGRFLAYVNGDSPHTLRLLDLATDTDLGIALPVTRSWPNCHQQLAWSPDGHTLAVLTVVPTGTDWRYQIVLLEPHTRSTPSVLLDVPTFSYLHGWLDSEHLLISRLQSLDGISLLLSLNRQGRTAPISEIPLGDQVCTTLSPAGTTLIFNQPGQVTRVRLPSGQQDALNITPDILLNSQHGLWRATPPELFWLEGGNRLLFSRLGTERRVWFISLDQPQQRPRNEDGLFLSPPYQPSVRLGVIGISPDERTLAVCEQPPSARENARFRQRTSRTWLYNISQDRWTLVRDNPGDWCDLVVGWGWAGGTQ